MVVLGWPSFQGPQVSALMSDDDNCSTWDLRADIIHSTSVSSGPIGTKEKGSKGHEGLDTVNSVPGIVSAGPDDLIYPFRNPGSTTTITP